MSSVAGIRLSLCLLRYGPQPGVPVPIMYFCRQKHSSSDSKSTTSGKFSSACGISTVAAQKKSKAFTADLSDMSDLDKDMAIAASVKQKYRRFITDSELVKNILYSLDPWDHRTTPVIMECNPGPGVLTRALLDAGCNVVALESNTQFLPGLKKLEKKAHGQLRVLHCDFFRLDPWADGIVQAPSMYSDALMEQLGISEVPWDTGIPFKVFAILNQGKERKLLWRYIFSLYERLSIFRYGRIELNFVISEALYKYLCAKPGDFRQYQAFTVLSNIAWDVQLLHKVPVSMFFTTSNLKGHANKSGKSSDDHVCLVRITPRRDLFSKHFTPSDGIPFINLVKQCLVQRRSKLLPKLDTWNPGEGERLLQRLALPENIEAGNIYPEEYKLLFEILTHSEEFNQSFVFDMYENMVCSAY
ncbi:dimethyladenosine transferase 2, mitochondrial isoform 1-T2 [Mantella aurantiaca]